ncbi:MAG: thioredoxin domain-containing protein [Sphingobium sp.]
MIKIAVFLLALTSAAATLPVSTSAAPNANWADRVTLSKIGGHVLGNPAARTKLVEYISYTCSHCAQFVGQASGPLKAGYVKGGAISVEVRNAVRDKYDLAAALLARCGGARRFFGNHEALFANQSAWMDRVIAYDRDGADKPTDEKAALREIGAKTGLYALMGKRGFKAPQLDACINDPAAMKAVLAMRDEAWNGLKIGGTPAFTLNGKLVDGVSTWDALKAALPAAAR